MPFLLPILSGILLGAGFIAPFLNYLCWIALIPLLFFIERENNRKKIFLAGFIAGLIFFSQLLIWFFNALPLEWAGIENRFIGFLTVFLLWLIPTLFLSLFIGFFSLSHHFLKKGKIFIIFLTPSLWIILEYLRSWGFSVLSAGNASLIGSHWTWGNLGYLLSQNQFFRSWASLGGVYLISFFIVLVNVLLFLIIKRIIAQESLSKKIVYSSVLFIIIILISLSYFFTQRSEEKGEKLKVAVIQTDFPSFFNQNKETAQKEFQIKTELFKEAINSSPQPDIIIFPEDSRFLTNENFEKLLNETNPQKDILIIDSSRTETPQGIKSIITFFDTKNGVLVFQEKLSLAPLGEYLPYIIKWAPLIFNKNWVKKFEESRGYQKGKEASMAPFKNTKIGGFLCSEILSADLYRKLAKNSEILFNMGSHSFAHGSQILNSQIESMARLRAAENGRYLIRATNQGLSYIINDKGNFITKSNKIGNQVLYGEVFSKKEKTPHTKYGDCILILALGIAIFTTIDKFRKKEYN